MSKWHIPFRARGGDPSARRASGREGDRRAARAVQGLRAPATLSAPAGPGPGTRGAERVRACGRVWECARVFAPGPRAGLCSYFPVGAFAFSLPLHFLSHWLINNEKKEGRKRFPKKVDCREAVCFRPLPPDGLCSAPFSVSLHLQSKLGGKKRGESCLLLPRSCPSFSCQLSSHLSGGCGN